MSGLDRRRDETADDLPVREVSYPHSKPGLDLGHMPGLDEDTEQKKSQQRRAVAKWSREDLEDKYLNLYEENIVLKKHARKQEEKIKKMATKLLRLVNDKKRKGQLDEGGGGSPLRKRVKDIETEEMLEELHGKVRELEKQNEQLKNKLIITKQQLSTQGKRHTPYTYVQSRIDTGKPKQQQERIQKNTMTIPGARSTTPRSMRTDVLPRYGHSLLEEARSENRNLEEYIRELENQMSVFEHDAEMLREQIRIKEEEHEEEMLRLNEGQRHAVKTNIQENVDQIRLQRELKEKSTKLTALESQYKALEENLRTVKASHDAVLAEMDSQNQHLQEEQGKVMALQNELKHGSATQRRIAELSDRIRDVENEKEILREANEKLLNSAFDAERERQFRANEKQLKLQIAQLEATLKGDLNDKNSILDKLTLEREHYDKLQLEHREMQINYFQVKEQLDELQEKMKFFSKESALDFQELEEALLLIKKRKEKGSQDLDFLERVDEELNKDLKLQITQLHAEHAETVQELEKTRNMLILQHKINRDYEQEVQNSQLRLEEYKKEYDTKLEEYAQLLDIRASRIKKLEAQLRDVAYGTKQYKLAELADEEIEGHEEIDETLHLERGQNVMEIHIEKIVFTKEALREFGDAEPATFATFSFFEFELQATPVLKSDKPEFNFTSQYIVTVDDFFLHHLMKESTTLEVHQAAGVEYHTMAACQLRFRDLLDKPHGRFHGQAQLVGVEGSKVGGNFGTVDYWTRLRVPMDQALRLFRERVKALGYITSNTKAVNQALEALEKEQPVEEARDKSMNEITIKIIRCSGLKTRREGVQPSAYVVYRFFDLNDHDTTIIRGSNNPEFNDTTVYPLPMNGDMDRYLRTESLMVYVFDDTDPEETSYLGLAKVPLISLAHDKPIKGTFELKKVTGEPAGSVDLQMKWQYSYILAKVATSTPKPSAKPAAPMSPAKPPVPLKTPGVKRPSIRERPAPLEAPLSAQEVSGSGGEEMTPAKQGKLHRVGEVSSGPIAASTPLVSEPRGEAAAANLSLNQDSTVLAPKPKPRARTVGLPSVQPKKREASEGEETLVENDKKFPQYDMHVTAPVMEEEEEMSLAERDDSDADDEIESVTEMARKPVTATLAADTIAEENEEDLVDSELRAQALGETFEKDSSENIEDTMFEEERDHETDSSIEEEVEIPDADNEDDEIGGLKKAQEVGDDEGISEDSEDIISTPLPSRPLSTMMPSKDTVTITVSHLSLDSEAKVVRDDSVEKLFVEYKFLDVPSEELETPFSLPKPVTDVATINFNFRKVFHVDAEENQLKRDYLASMLLPEDPSNGRIRFVVVGEPPEKMQEELNCEEVGFADVDIRKILKDGRDIKDQDIDIMELNDASTVIGTLNVTVECFEALKSVEKELPPYQ